MSHTLRPPHAADRQAPTETLSWPGKRAPADAPLLPGHLEQVEVHGPVDHDPDILLAHGDNLAVLRHWREQWAGKVDLVYVDPPFDSQADYAQTLTLRQPCTQGPAMRLEVRQYADRWAPGAYLQFMYERLVALRDLMAPRASIWLHCDWHRSHHLRCLMDEVFGAQNFLNEVVWHYQSGGRAKRTFARKHDTLLWYARGRQWDFFPEEVAEVRGSARRNHMKRGQDEDGRIYYAIRSNGREYRYYEDERIAPDDVWDLAHLQQRDPERTGYPTQKPEALLERLLRACSRPDARVLDAFMGSGTSAAVAARLGRRYLGIDANPQSVHLAAARAQAVMPADWTLAQAQWAGAEAAVSEGALEVVVEGDELRIARFCPPRLMAHLREALGPQAPQVALELEALDPRALIAAIVVDWHHTQGPLKAQLVDRPAAPGAVQGRYAVPRGATQPLVCAVDLLGDRHTCVPRRLDGRPPKA